MDPSQEPSAFQEEDIRPAQLMAEQARAFSRDIQMLLQFRSTFVRVPCPACGANEGAEELEKYGFTYQRCSVCGTVYVNPRPAPEVLEYYYQNSENYRYWTTHIFPASEKMRREKIFIPRARKVTALSRKYHSQPESLMDVGAGFGTFCHAIRDLNVFSRIIAVEPTPDLAAACRKRGLEVLETRFEDAEMETGTVDVITSFEVIEHLFDPGRFIAGCARFLKRGGLLVVTCPNIDGFETAVLGALSDTIDVEHLNYFNPDSLSKLLKAHDFEILEVTTPGMLDAELVRKKILSGHLDISAQPFLRRILIDEWERLGSRFQDFLAENELSSHMWVVARKR